MVRCRRCILCGVKKHLFSFPKTKEERSKWIQALELQLSLNEIKASDKVCAGHFTIDQFLYRNEETLKPHACPSLIVLSIPRLEMTETENVEQRKKDICVICGVVVAESFHSFPMDISRRSSWADFCQVELNKITARSRLCNIHFTKYDFRMCSRRILKNNSIPTQFPRLLTQISGIALSTAGLVTHTNEVPQTARIVSTTCQGRLLSEDVIAEKVESSQRMTDLQSYNEGTTTTAIVPSNSPVSQSIGMETACEAQIQQERIEFESSRRTSMTTDGELSVVASTSAHPKRYFRSFGEITEDDVVTPKRARLALKMGKDALQKCRRRIAVLRNAKSRLQAKVFRLNGALEELQKQLTFSSYC